ncbi:hypothetical protein V2J85_24940 [Streptomyces sp. DSM 41528]|uniref:Cysteine methyltransferase n=1 Tax=Streptomyces bugieae TaxID=3098223 RepID=A0ABU7NUT1_9ACTN|nr:hypothetical protein [Streptomyces nigrescens]MEE4422566.1 hypothetical protein [Streptomyces sp. DSM 41528]
MVAFRPRALEPGGRGTRLFLVHEGFGPDGPYQVPAHRVMGGGRRSIVGECLGQVLDEL